MPDDTFAAMHPHPVPPHDWNEAFAALPLETPDAESWQRIRRVHDARGNGARWPTWLAIAGMLALVAALPLRLAMMESASDTTAMPAVVPVSPPVTMAATPRDDAATTAPILKTTQRAPAQTDAPALEHAANPPVRGVVYRQRDKNRDTTRPASMAAVSAEASPTTTRDTGVTTTAEATQRPWPRSTPDAELERLYAQSAQLEALVTMARDDRFVSGAAATMASAYDAQVASIDASLRDPGVSESRRAALWTQRVDALRQLAGFESAQRALAAQGNRYDAMLVSID